LRKPYASLPTVLITRLVPSEPALVIPVRMNARISGHQVCTVVARRSSSGRPDSAHRVVEPVQQVGDVLTVRIGAGQCEQV
jgi:hypothetical protein